MSATYTIILRDCPPASRTGVAVFLGKAFSLKESTCTAISASAPIILVSGLAREEAAALSLTLSGIQRLGGVIEFSTADLGDLPKIDWPRRPLVFKREITEHLEDLQTSVPGPDGRRHTLIDLLLAGLNSSQATVSGDLDEVEVVIGIKPAASAPRVVAAPQRTPAPAAEFKSIPMPEITPFSNPVLPGKSMTPAPSAPAAKDGSDDPAARLGELFPEEDSPGFVPNNEDITNILDRLLPDDDAAPAAAGKPATSGSRRTPVVGAPTATNGSGGFSVFLAKIADEAKRTKAIELIADLAKITKDEADSLSKKVIIPVLKGATKDEAEAAKQKFAKIGILARVKGPE